LAWLLLVPLLSVLSAPARGFEAPRTCVQVLNACELLAQWQAHGHSRRYRDEQVAAAGFCVGFMRAQHEYARMAHELWGADICLPAETRPEETQQIIVRWIRLNPEGHTDPGTLCAVRALLEAFPCQAPDPSDPGDGEP
jgi:hypothetical protein